ncbi:MAG TPA: hypothetical protein PLM14_13380 [Candidatus Hydrogenedentes bacterium]|nr:hypothetical protein [Candidatus Hydrogenedentota bacterium]
MPCNDISERVEVVFDADDRLASYVLHKRACGRAVGAESFLDFMLTGRTLDEIADTSPEELLKYCRPQSDAEAFLALKHLFAVQAACAVLRGAAAGGLNNACTAARIGFEDGHTRLTGLIRVTALHGVIEACGRCSRCPAGEDV